MTKGDSNEQIFRFVRLESVACDPYAGAGRRRGCSAVALAERLRVRPVPARAMLHAWARTEMAREAWARRWVVKQGALYAAPNTPLGANTPGNISSHMNAANIFNDPLSHHMSMAAT
jgi:hypothetical protein